MHKKSVHIARRMTDIQPFHVMDILARARQLEAAGRSIVHMEIGEPDFVTAETVVRAGQQALEEGKTHYTPAMGITELRQAISNHYRNSYGIDVAPERIIITPGSSGALQLICGVLIDPGQQLLMADPGYPCNRHFVRLMEGSATSVPVGPETSYQLTAELVTRHWQEATVAALLASPSNPTGTVIGQEELQAILNVVSERDGRLIVDEIYHGLIYEGGTTSVLALTDQAFVVNSFSKYFGMTGWRIGWLVAPLEYVREIEKLAQNIFISASTPAQYAALAAFDPETIAILEQRKAAFRERRDFLLPALRELGFEIPLIPPGAFYIYADCSRFTDDSYRFALQLLEATGVAITPGVDFGHYRPERHVRFAYTTSLAQLREGVARLKRHLAA
ncbi:MAG: pyridoxal phosphate-dependent aminotransferase [Proteobacteria bacterium]|nr:MAG: pyridoxal phosphate-dependent aminotransferase [Pseudomonadota bacterium]QKK12505.1 MAG: pyridoxal phosphate-dependent aminotransferase [Pseudomonadota bacterium]